MWTSRGIVNQTMPACFKANYPATPIIIDSSSFRAQSQTYSSYKSHNTAERLAGIAPSGIVTFISGLYGGHISDKKMTQECGHIHLLESGGVVMVIGGFDIQHLLASKCLTLNIPPVLRGKEQLSLEEVETRSIASVCIHVERAIERVNNDRILQGVTIDPH